MSDEAVVASLRYLVKGVRTTRDAKSELQQELAQSLPHAHAITVLPVVEGFSVEIEVTDLKPFNRTSFEPYVAEHVLPDAVRLRCERTGELGVQLLKSYFV